MIKRPKGEVILEFKQRYRNIWGKEPAGLIRPEELTVEEQCAIFCDSETIEECSKICPLAWWNNLN